MIIVNHQTNATDGLKVDFSTWLEKQGVESSIEYVYSDPLVPSIDNPSNNVNLKEVLYKNSTGITLYKIGMRYDANDNILSQRHLHV